MVTTIDLYKQFEELEKLWGNINNKNKSKN